MKIFIKTFGCTMNHSDSEVMAGILAVAGHEFVEEKDAEMILFNTCTVKDSPEKSFYSQLKKCLSQGKKVVVAGCISQADPLNPELKEISIVGTTHLEMIAEVVEKTASGQVVKLLNFKKSNRLNLPKIRRNPVVEIIPINSGCLGECSFCKTRFARGTLYSYEPKAIASQMKAAVKDGVREIWLTSQDLAAYGRDIGTNLPALLKELVKIKGNYKIRLGMMNPNLAKDFIDELCLILNDNHFFKFLHLPVQSGSDKVLKDMKRKYCVDDFKNEVAVLRKKVPGITIATDIICGFPTETEKDHEKTMALIRELKIPIINFTKFYPRRGTVAAKMKLLPTKLVKKRSMELVALQKKIVDNSEWRGWAGEIIVDEIGKNNSFVGRNDCYKAVVVKSKDISLGQIVKVKVLRVEQFHLEAELV